MKTRFTSFAMALAMMLILGTATSLATEPEKVTKTKATYDLAELKRNVGKDHILATNESSERVTFTVAVDKTGEIKDLTYTHNITSVKSAKVDAYIQKAYMAIMSTEFHPAKQDGQAIQDTVTIEFQMIN